MATCLLGGLLALIRLDGVDYSLSPAVHTIERMTRSFQSMRITATRKQRFFSPGDNAVHLLQPNAIVSKLLIIFDWWLNVARIIMRKRQWLLLSLLYFIVHEASPACLVARWAGNPAAKGLWPPSPPARAGDRQLALLQTNSRVWGQVAKDHQPQQWATPQNWRWRISCGAQRIAALPTSVDVCRLAADLQPAQAGLVARGP